MSSTICQSSRVWSNLARRTTRHIIKRGGSLYPERIYKYLLRHMVPTPSEDARGEIRADVLIDEFNEVSRPGTEFLLLRARGLSHPCYIVTMPCHAH